MPTQVDNIGEELATYLGMAYRPIGVKLLREKVDEPLPRRPEKPVAFCRAVKDAARGEDILMRLEDEDCVDAEVVLGYRESRYVKVEPRVKTHTDSVRIGPLESADVVLLILNPEQVQTMSMLLGGITAHFSGTLSICGEGVARVIEEQKTNVTFLCNGARIFGEFAPHDVVLVLPYSTFLELPTRMARFKSLSQKAKAGLGRLLVRL